MIRVRAEAALSALQSAMVADEARAALVALAAAGDRPTRLTGDFRSNRQKLMLNRRKVWTHRHVQT